jgi:tyrosine decarboxylase/aspartate 1-decarboxylase
MREGDTRDALVPIPSDPRDLEALRSELDVQRDRDASFEDGDILGSMCTAPHPEARRAYEAFLEGNLGDPSLFPGTRDLEAQAGTHLLDLVSAPSSAEAVFTSGGSEANLVALRIAREETGGSEVLLPETAHFSFRKACSILDLEPVWIPTTDGEQAEVSAVEDAVGPETACVVGVAGTTEFGTVDPLPELAAVAGEAGVPLHVDAALGGFILPFLEDLPDLDLARDGVVSITLDPHKMGRAAIPCGGLAVASSDLAEGVAVESPYVSTAKQVHVTGTRPGAAPVAAYAAMEALGRSGYEEQARRCLRNARYLAEEARRVGATVPVDPVLNVVSVACPGPEAARDALAEAGFHVNLAPATGGIKVVCMPHVTRDRLDDLVPELAEVLKGQGVA